jgi:hypothetical protein
MKKNYMTPATVEIIEYQFCLLANSLINNTAVINGKDDSIVDNEGLEPESRAYKFDDDSELEEE